MCLPESIGDLEQLEELLSRPTPALVEMMQSLPGDILLLGVGGKMGPSLARMARRATDEAGVKRKILGVARFSEEGLRESLEQHGIETVRCDLFDSDALASLPSAPNIVYMAARKFGSSGDEPQTWAVNALLPGLVCRRFPGARIAAFSTGNVYPFSPIEESGSSETDPTGPVGEYAMSCLGRERMFEHASRQDNTLVSTLRLNYAHDLRYGVMVDLAQRIWDQKPIDLTMGYFNAIWQGDANAMTLRSLDQAESPPNIFNLAGKRVLSVQEVCEQLATKMNRSVHFTGEPAPNALLSNGAKGHKQLGEPTVSEEHLLDWTAQWISQGGQRSNKPTHFQTRDGKF